jgi:hypothetical protein
LLGVVHETIEGGAHGLVLSLGLQERPECAWLLRGAHALVHQGVSVEEALALAEKPEVRTQESEGEEA